MFGGLSSKGVSLYAPFAMPMIILHDLNGDEVLVNTDTIVAARRKVPDEKAVIQEPFTKLYYTSKDKGMDIGFPDVVAETPQQIIALSNKSVRS